MKQKFVNIETQTRFQKNSFLRHVTRENLLDPEIHLISTREVLDSANWQLLLSLNHNCSLTSSFGLDDEQNNNKNR